MFVLGSPGSGKSTVIRRYIEPLTKDLQYSPEHINDYKILMTMFQEDLKKNQQGRRFAASEHNGFNVLDFVVLDKALQRLERTTKTHLSQKAPATTRPLLPVIEFSRNDYRRAFQQFSSLFLRDAYFIYLDTSLENCRRRIRERVEKPSAEKTKNDYYVSDEIFETYYNHKENTSLTRTLEMFGIEKGRVLIVNNNVQPAMVSQEIRMFVYNLIKNIQLEVSRQMVI